MSFVCRQKIISISSVDRLLACEKAQLRNRSTLPFSTDALHSAQKCSVCNQLFQENEK